MKRALLLIIFVFVIAGTSLVAQGSFTIEPIPATATADLQTPSTYPGDVIAHAVVKNNTSQILKLSWIRNEVVMPQGWATGVCDINYCYEPDVARRDFELQPNASGTLDVHFYPGGIPGSLENGAIPGEATVYIKVTNKDDNTDTLSGIFMAEVTGDPIVSSLSEVELEALKLFPNPTSDYFTLSSNDNDIASLTIHNILGRQIRQYPAAERRFEVSDLPHGLYLVSVLDKQERVLKTLRLQKR